MCSQSTPRPHDDFVEFLQFPDLQESYERDARNVIRKVRRDLEKDKVEIIEAIKRGIREDADHRKALNACIYPFAQGQIPGYYFVCAAPLSEVSESNFDFFIVCRDPPAAESQVAIFGEAKGPFNDPDPVVSQTKDRIAVVEDKWDYIRNQYLSGIDFPREFVLGVFASDAPELSKSIIRKQGGIVVWSIDLSNDPILRLLRPDLLARADTSIRETMLHRNDTLNSILGRKLLTHPSFKSFYEQSHPVAKLSVLTSIDKGAEDGTFTSEDLRDLVREALDYVSEKVIAQETSKILTYGLNIGFIRDVGKGRFKVKSRSKNADVRERDIGNLWIRWRLKEELRKRMDPKLVELQEAYETKKKAIPTLEEFVSYEKGNE